MSYGCPSAQDGGGVLQPTVAVLTDPVVTWVAPLDGATLIFGEQVTLALDLAGADGGLFAGHVTILSNRDGVLCDFDVTDTTASCAPVRRLSLGTHQLTAFVTDATGTAAAVITVQVVNAAAGTANNAPTVIITRPQQGEVFETGTLVTFVAQVTDPNVPLFPDQNIRWVSSIDGDLGAGTSLTVTGLSPGTHVITAAAVDAFGAIGTDTVTIHISSRPVVTIQQPTSGAIVSSGTPITLSATVTDADEPLFPARQILWQSDLDGDLGTGTTIAAALSNGRHTITVAAVDDFGLIGADSVTVTVQPPLQ